MFFHFSQNNSGGVFTAPAHHLVVEADTADEAVRKAESLGCYFDGAGDCPCCGDRWSDYSLKGTETPQVYDHPALEYEDFFADRINADGIPSVLVAFKDGTVISHSKQKKSW